MKHLIKKPCSTFKDDDYLKLKFAEQKGLIEIKFESSDLLSEYTSPNCTLIEKLISFYQKDEYNKVAEKWNLQRAQVIENMCNKYLFPEFENELRSKLLNEAKLYVFNECALKLRSIIMTAPFGVNDSDDELTILVITYLTSQDILTQESVCSYIDGDGELVDFIQLDKMIAPLSTEKMSTHPSDATIKLHVDKQEKIKALGRLQDYILEKMPKVIAVATESKDALTIVEDVKFILQCLVENNSNNMKLKGKKFFTKKTYMCV
jgi:transcriptional accessory protein Tex/SPT6